MKQVFETAGRVALAFGLMAGLSACESGARQDSFLVRGSTDDIVFSNVPIVRDRTVDQTLLSALELTDYTVALRDTGLLDTLRRAGPFTVFAVPNEPLEAAQTAASGQLLMPAAKASLRRVMAYTIVRGRYTEARLRRMIARGNGPIGLTTIEDHDVLTVSADPATGALLLSDPQGRTSRLWLANVPQSNGVLYVTQSMLAPAPNLIASSVAPAPMTSSP